MNDIKLIISTKLKKFVSIFALSEILQFVEIDGDDDAEVMPLGSAGVPTVGRRPNPQVMIPINL